MVQNLENARFNMVEQQVRPCDVLDARVLEAMSVIDRAQFVCEEQHGLAYADTNLPLGYGQEMFSPVLEGRILQAVNVQENEYVLEIGTGSGYLTALLAQLSAGVTSVEIVAELSAMAGQHLASAGIKNVTLMIGDASEGWAMDARIDVIICSAAVTFVPESYLQMLTVGGRLLAFVGEGNMMEAQLISRVTEQEWETRSVFETAVIPMINAEPQPAFEF